MKLIRVIEIFDKAAEKLKYPKIKEIQIISGLPALTLSRYTDRSKTPGAVSVNDLSAEWLGRVTREGSFQPSRNCPDWVEKALLFFCADPQAAIINHGKLTGRCCFCNTKLTDERSLSMGYGPTCAKNFGLDWGESRLSTGRLMWEQWVKERQEASLWVCNYEAWIELTTSF